MRERGRIYFEADGNCVGMPFFCNIESDEWICGEADKETLKNWAKGKEVN